MRGMLAGAFLTLLVPQAVAQTAGIPHPGGAAEINVLTPGVVYNAGLQDLAADYAGQTGIKVTVRNDGMAAIVGDIKKAAPIADVIVLPVAFMDGMEAEQAIVAGSRSDLGRDSVWLAVKRGAPHPDISTPEKLARALKTGVVLYSNPASGSMEARIINDMLRRYPVFQGVRSRISIKGEGGEALMRGEGDMALQLACEVLNHPEIELAGLVPAELGAYIDTAVAVSARSTQAEAARAFIVWLLRPEHAALWKSRGLNRR
ncbi:MAG TPA: substrate-binding domain-containing protein [Rhizomicrobium sp.]